MPRYSALYTRAAAIFGDLAVVRADGSFRNPHARLTRADVLNRYVPAAPRKVGFIPGQDILRFTKCRRFWNFAG